MHTRRFGRFVVVGWIAICAVAALHGAEAGDESPALSDRRIEGVGPGTSFESSGQAELDTYRYEKAICPLAVGPKGFVAWRSAPIPPRGGEASPPTLVWGGVFLPSEEAVYALSVNDTPVLRFRPTGQAGRWGEGEAELRFLPLRKGEGGEISGLFSLTLPPERVGEASTPRLRVARVDGPEGPWLALTPYDDVLGDWYAGYLEIRPGCRARPVLKVKENRVDLVLCLPPGEQAGIYAKLPYEAALYPAEGMGPVARREGRLRVRPESIAPAVRVLWEAAFPAPGRYVADVVVRQEESGGRVRLRQEVVLPDRDGWPAPLAEASLAFRRDLLAALEAALPLTTEHPRLFGKAGRFRKRMKRDLPATQEVAVERARELIALLEEKGATTPWAELEEMLFLASRLWLFTDEPAYRDASRAALVAALQRLREECTAEAVTGLEGAYAHAVRLGLASEAADVLLAEEILFTPEERLRLVRSFQEVFARFRESPWIANPPETKTLRAREGALYAELAMAGLLLQGDVPEVGTVATPAVSGVVDALGNGGADGVWPEGPAGLALLLDAACRLGWRLSLWTDGAADLLAHPYLKTAGDYALAAITPSKTVWNLGDASPETDLGLPLAVLAARTKRGDLQWGAYLFQASDRLVSFPYYDTDLKPEMPIDAGPLRVFPETGLGVYRSGWERDALYVALSGRPVYTRGGHEEAGSLFLHAFGETLLGELGGWPRAEGYDDFRGDRWSFDNCVARAHSTLMVDGRGQNHAPWSRGHIVHRGAEADAVWMVMNLTPAYADRVSRAVRFVVVLPRAERVLLLDALAMRDGPRSVAWHYLLPAEGLTGTPVPGAAVTLAAGDARLRLGYVALPHRTDFRTGVEARSLRYPVASGVVHAAYESLVLGPREPVREIVLLSELVPYRAAEGEPVPLAMQADVARLGEEVVPLYLTLEGKRLRLTFHLAEGSLSVQDVTGRDKKKRPPEAETPAAP